MRSPRGNGAHRDRDLGQSRSRLSRDESGSILVLFALFVTLFIMVAAIAIDVGYWWTAGRKAQIAADACALAAAGEADFPKPISQTHCTFGSKDWVFTNIPDQLDKDKGMKHLGTTVTAPYKSTPRWVEAEVDLRVRTFFGRIVGLGHIDLTRRAVAEKQEGEGNYAIYSHSAGCPDDGSGNSLRFNGNTHWINGRVHSNGEYFVDNQGAEPFWAKVGTKVTCDSLQPPNQPRFGGDGWATGQTKPDTVPVQTWPAWFTPADFGWIDDLSSGDTGCDVKGKSILIKEDSGGTRIEIDSPIGTQPAQLFFPGNVITAAYTYCAWEKFTINRINLVATLTALSPLITVDGDNQSLQPHAGTPKGKMLFFAVPNITSAQDGSFPGGNPSCQFGLPPNPEMILNGNSHEWTGVLFNPCGRVVVNVGGSTIGNPAITGTILGMQVHVNGQNFFMQGKDTFGGDAALALVE